MEESRLDTPECRLDTPACSVRTDVFYGYLQAWYNAKFDNELWAQCGRCYQKDANLSDPDTMYTYRLQTPRGRLECWHSEFNVTVEHCIGDVRITILLVKDSHNRTTRDIIRRLNQWYEDQPASE